MTAVIDALAIITYGIWAAGTLAGIVLVIAERKRRRTDYDHRN